MQYQYIIGIGSNLPSSQYQTPLETCQAALHQLQENPLIHHDAQMLHIVDISRWYRCPPVPVSDQPWFVNAVFRCISALPPEQCLLWLHKIEQDFERIRRTRNEARTLDLDMILQIDETLHRPTQLQNHVPNIPNLQHFSSLQEMQHLLNYKTDIAPIIPHPRMTNRHFVLYPLQDIFVNFRHPETNKHIYELIAELDPSYEIYPIDMDTRSLHFAK